MSAAPIKAWAAMEKGAALTKFEYTPGPLGNDEVELAVETCGICHSDLSMVNNEWYFASYPLVPGHEVIGKIAAVGAGVKGVKVGQRVGLGWHAGYCGACEDCHSSDENLCARSVPTIAGGARGGGFGDRVRASERAVVPIPDSVDAKSAGPLLCGGITVFNPLLQFQIKPTDRVGVVGIGGLGHLALQFYAKWGCHVTAFTSTKAKAAEAKAFGARDVIDSTSSEELKAAARSFDLLVVTANVKLDWKSYLGTLRPKGRLHFVGAVVEPIPTPVFALLGRQLSISASPVGSPAAIAKMLDFAGRHGVKPQCEYFDMNDEAAVRAAMGKVADGTVRYRAVLVRESA